MELNRSEEPKLVALVTGANKGLGFETARQLAGHGIKVFLGARDFDRGQTAADLLIAEGLDVEALPLDVTSRESINAAAERIAVRFERLDILVNNAGIAPEAAIGFVVPLDFDLFTRTFETNVFGVVAVTQRFLPLLMRSVRGRIVNISSTVGSFQDQTDETSGFYGMILPGYQASKTALNALSVSQAKALRHTKVKINSICPGWVRTDLGGLDAPRAPRSPEEGAQIVVKLATIPDSGPNGGFFDYAGAVAW